MFDATAWRAGGIPCASSKQKSNAYASSEDEFITGYLIKLWWEKEAEHAMVSIDWHDRMAEYLHNQKNRAIAKRMLNNGWA